VIDGPFALAFVSGLIAVVNPCGFAMLPAYLSYFLGVEYRAVAAGQETEQAGVGRAVVVSLAVSLGFLTVFTSIGAVAKIWTQQIVEVMNYVGIVVGVALIGLGIAMLLGYRLPLVTPKLDRGGRSRTVWSMYVFGISYAIASLGCTIGPFLGIVIGSFSRDDEGFVSGVLTIAMYGAGMALLLTALTVTLALAQGGLLRRLRAAMKYVDVASGVLLVLAGLYVTYYGWYLIASDTGARDVRGAGLVEWFQSRAERTQAWLGEQGVWTLVLVLGGIICLALFVVLLARTPSDEPQDHHRTPV
jgi:cytochrome c biogenesis protein CcdA